MCMRSPPLLLGRSSVAPSSADADKAGRHYAKGLLSEYMINVEVPSAEACANMMDAHVKTYQLIQECVLCKDCGHLWHDLPATIKSGRRALPPERLAELRGKTCA